MRFAVSSSETSSMWVAIAQRWPNGSRTDPARSPWMWSAMAGDELAARHAMSPRTLQRRFRRYAGVSPKWVLHRYRLH